MELAQFLKPVKPASVSAEPASGAVSAGGSAKGDMGHSSPAEVPVTDTTSPPAVTVYRDTTPSGIVVEYSPGDGTKENPRWYKVNGVEVPSVTTVLDVLRKDGLSWWGMKVGVEGVIQLVNRGRLTTVLDWLAENQVLSLDHGTELQQYNPNADHIVKALTGEKLTVNHALNRAGDRGTNVHSALEAWASSGCEFAPTPQNFPEEEQPYVSALIDWIDDLDGAARVRGQEVMVGSVEHGFAGRFDLVIELLEPRALVRKSYKRKDSVKAKVDKGLYLCDLKSSSGVYPTSHFRQLAAYELAAVECGYPPTDGQFILHVSKDGRYQFVPSTATSGDFLAALNLWKSDESLKGR